MREVLNQKLQEYQNSYFENKEFRAWLKDSNLWLSSFSVLRLRGIEMDKKELVEVLEGKIMENVPLELYGMLHSFRDLYKEMQASLGMQESLNAKLLNRFYSMVFDDDGYRRDNPVVFKWNYVPMHFTGIEGAIENLCKDVDKMKDPIERAIKVHLGLNTIYPYGNNTSIMALIAMYYELMRFEIPLPSLIVDEEDYDKIMKAYLAEGTDDFSDMFIRSEINRLDQVLMYGIESRER